MARARGSTGCSLGTGRLTTGTIRVRAALQRRLLTLLTEHQAAQRRERDIAGELWGDQGFGFTGRTGHPIDPRADNHEGTALLKEAAVREARLHDVLVRGGG